MAIIDDVILKLRRRIGDTEKPYTITDDTLYNSIWDAVDILEGTYPLEGFDISVDDIGFNREITNQEASIIALQAYIQYKKGLKHKADSENFKMQKGKLSLDNTNQAKDHAQSIENLEVELSKMFGILLAKDKKRKIYGIGGARVQSGGE